MFTVYTISGDSQIIPDLAAFAPFLILIIGYIITVRNVQVAKKEESKNYLCMIVTWISNSKARTLQQAVSLKKYSIELSKYEHIQNISMQNEPLLYGKLNRIKLEDALKYLVTNIKAPEEEKVKIFSELIININYLDEVEQIVLSNYIQANADFISVATNFNEHLELLENIFFTKHIEIRSNVTNPDNILLKQYDALRLNLDNQVVDPNKEQTGKKYFELLVDPALIIFKDHYKKYPESEFCYNMHSELSQLLKVKRQWEHYKTLHSSSALLYSKEIEKSYNILEGCVKFYKMSKAVGNFYFK